ncbi:MscL family protein [Ornithinibacillus halophilus]|uniref:Large conductance mechanosensitive channel n=1 Tax=Ornithinibacillus halophilus TaxID=930117 RepID=A0A1M5NED8_9BACI|nr:MscL family protein [Ornithinibacillus halophilus]SHG87827.1 large conductance mechanosensitive channel [Ornithinibacillus halophilus]
MGLFKEFRHFTMRGSAIDMGIGVVLGAALSSFIDSLVRDMLLPPIGLFISKMNIENLYISLSGRTFSSLAEAQEAGAVTINYGLFISNDNPFYYHSIYCFSDCQANESMEKTTSAPTRIHDKKRVSLLLHGHSK